MKHKKGEMINEDQPNSQYLLTLKMQTALFKIAADRVGA